MSDSKARDDEVPERTDAPPRSEDDLTASLGHTDRRVLLRGALGHFALLVASGRAASTTPGASPLDCGEYTRGTPSVLVLDTDCGTTDPTGWSHADGDCGLPNVAGASIKETDSSCTKQNLQGQPMSDFDCSLQINANGYAGTAADQSCGMNLLPIPLEPRVYKDEACGIQGGTSYPEGTPFFFEDSACGFKEAGPATVIEDSACGKMGVYPATEAFTDEDCGLLDPNGEPYGENDQ